MITPRIRRTKTAKKAAAATVTPHLDARSFPESTEADQRSIKYRAEETIYRQGDPAEAVFYVEKGGVGISVISAHGRKGTIARPRNGEFFGEGCLAGQDLRLATATAIGPTIVTRIDKATMVRTLQKRSALSEKFLSFLQLRNIQVEAELITQLFNSTEQRLARALFLLAKFGKEGKLEKVIPKVSTKILAAQVGTTLARIEFFMKKFRRMGFIEYDDGSKAKSNDTLKVHTSLLNIIVHD